jgi:predicted dehydrogenase
MLNIAILSGWHVHAEGYAKALQKRADVRVTALWDDDAERGKAFAERLGVPYGQSLDALLKRADVDAVCVVAPTAAHKDVIIKCAAAGKHIFTEKVLAPTNAEAAAIRYAVEQSGVRFCISFPFRTFPQCLYAKKLAEGGTLGDIYMLRVRNAHNGASDGWLPERFYDAEECCGGAMMDLGAHPLYIVAWLLGKPEELASAFTYATGKAVEDNAVTVMKYKNGALAVAETGFVSAQSPFALEMYGTEGTLLVSGDDTRLYRARDRAWSVPELPAPQPLPLDQFVDGVLYGSEIPFGLDDAVTLTALMDAAYKSHEAGAFVKV